MRTFLLFCILITGLSIVKPVLAQSGANNHFKYWTYHDRLEEIFIKVGYVAPAYNGCYDHGYNYSIPTPSARVVDTLPGEHFLRFGDGLIYTGWYLNTLASEYELLSQQGLPTDSTLRRIALVLEALDRLDVMAEQVPPYSALPFNGTNCDWNANRNGFLLRNDAQIYAFSNNLTSTYPDSRRVNASIDTNSQGEVTVNGWPIRHFGDDPWPNPGDVPSDYESFDYNYIGQDQLTWLFTGLSAIRRFIPDQDFQIDLDGDGNKEGFHIRLRTKWLTERIMDRLHGDDYLFMVDGITRGNEPMQIIGETGGNARLFSYGLRKAAIYICNEQDGGRWARDNGLNEFGSWLVWQKMKELTFFESIQASYAEVLGVDDDFIGSSFTYSMILNLAAIGSSWYDLTPGPLGFIATFLNFLTLGAFAVLITPALLLGQNLSDDFFDQAVNFIASDIWDAIDNLNLPNWVVTTLSILFAIVGVAAIAMAIGIAAVILVAAFMAVLYNLVIGVLTSIPIFNNTAYYVGLGSIAISAPFFSAYHQSLHGGSNLIPESTYENLLESAPCFGPHFSCPDYPGLGCYTNQFGCDYGGWNSDNRFILPDHIDKCSHQNTADREPLRFSGTDYMAMLNIYRIYNPGHFLRYDNFMFNDINIDFPWTAPNGTVYGNAANPAFQYGHIYVRPRGLIMNGAKVQFVCDAERGAVDINALDVSGLVFETTDGAEMEAYYETVECQDNMGGRMAAPSNSTNSRRQELPTESAPVAEYTLGEVLGWRQHFIDSLHFTSQEADTLFTDGLIPSPDLMQRLLEVVDPSMNPNPAPAPPNVQIYPNPCADRLSVSCDRAYPGVYNCTLLNANLQELARFTVGGENCTTVLGVTNFPRGIYTLRIEIPGSETLHVKVVLN